MALGGVRGTSEGQVTQTWSTAWMSSSGGLAEEMRRECKGTHIGEGAGVHNAILTNVGLAILVPLWKVSSAGSAAVDERPNKLLGIVRNRIERNILNAPLEGKNNPGMPS